MDVDQLKPSESHRLVPVSKVEVVPGIVNDTWILVVHGTVPCANMTVTLEPAVYIRQPEYWRIEVVGTLPGGICLTALKDYSAALPLAGVRGTCGIEVIGDGFAQKLEVPPVADDETEAVYQVREVGTAVQESAPPKLLISAAGTASSSGWSNPRLVPRPLPDGLAADGIADFDFVADRPDGMVLQVLTPIAASLSWADFGQYEGSLKGVRVHARSNALEELLEGTAPPPSLQQKVELPYQQAVQADDGALALQLDEVADSRCPANVFCVWQGFVEVTITATPKGGEAEQVKLSSLDNEPVALASGHHLKLIDVAPYPVAGAKLAPPIATVMVMR